MQEVVDQTVLSSHMKRYGLLREMSAAILFLASDEASCITGSAPPPAAAIKVSREVCACVPSS